jgi:putative ABC transport system substrate-binding protein
MPGWRAATSDQALTQRGDDHLRLSTSATRRVVLAASSVALLPRIAGAQPPKRRRIAFLSGASHASVEPFVRGLREGLRALGYGDDDIELDERYADGHFERLAELAAELVRLAPEVILAASPPVVQALKQTPSTIPVVMTTVGDPVGLGFIASLAHPGGKFTGLSSVSQDMAGKWVELLKIAIPGAERIAFLLNSANPAYSVVLEGAQQAARSLRIELLPVDARAPDEIEGAFAAVVRAHADALIGWGDPVFVSQTSRIVEFAATRRLPAIYQFREFVDLGGLMSFGPDRIDLYRRAAAYVDKILKGAKPADLPVEQPTKFQLVVNLKTAQALGLTIPQLILARADEVIE